MRVANQGFPGLHWPQATDFKVFTKHESRDTSHGLYVFHESRITWSEPGPPTMVLTKHETRNTAFMLFTNHSFPTSRHFPAPAPTPLRRSSVHAPSAFLGQPPGLPRRAAPPGRCFPARCGAAWGAPSHCSRTILTSNMTIRVFTRHETRLFSRVLRPSGGEKCRPGHFLLRHGARKNPRRRIKS